MNPIKPILNTLNILFIAIFMMMLVFGAVVAYLLTSGDITGSPELKNIFNLVVPIVFLGAIVIANTLAKKKLGDIDPTWSLENKLKKYQVVLIIRCAALESAGTLAAVAGLVTGYLYYLAGVLGAAILFYTIRPSAGVITNDLSLSQQEKIQLES